MKFSVSTAVPLLVCCQTLAFAQDHIVPFLYEVHNTHPVPKVIGYFENDDKSSDHRPVSFLLATGIDGMPNRPNDLDFQRSCYAHVLDSNSTEFPLRLNCTGGSVRYNIEDRSEEPLLPIGIGSNLFNSIGSFMWVPPGHDGGFLALSPESPERYCMDNEMIG